jgi:hypothetical protein
MNTLPSPCRPVLLFLALFLLCAAPAARAATSPLEAITTAQKGISSHDYALLRQGVDVSSVLDKATDSLLAELKRQMNEGNMVGDSTITTLLLMLVDDDSGKGGMVRSLLQMEAENLLRTAVNAGYIDGKPDPSKSGNAGMFKSALKELGRSKKRLAPGKVLKEQDDSATVSASFVDSIEGIFPLELRMEKEQGQWRVKEIMNLRQLIEQATAGMR